MSTLRTLLALLLMLTFVRDATAAEKPCDGKIEAIEVDSDTPVPSDGRGNSRSAAKKDAIEWAIIETAWSTYECAECPFPGVEECPKIVEVSRAGRGYPSPIPGPRLDRASAAFTGKCKRLVGTNGEPTNNYECKGVVTLVSKKGAPKPKAYVGCDCRRDIADDVATASPSGSSCASVNYVATNSPRAQYSDGEVLSTALDMTPADPLKCGEDGETKKITVNQDKEYSATSFDLITAEENVFRAAIADAGGGLQANRPECDSSNCAEGASCKGTGRLKYNYGGLEFDGECSYSPEFGGYYKCTGKVKLAKGEPEPSITPHCEDCYDPPGEDSY